MFKECSQVNRNDKYCYSCKAVELQCQNLNCNKIFKRKRALYNYALSKGYRTYHSISCAAKCQAKEKNKIRWEKWKSFKQEQNEQTALQNKQAVLMDLSLLRFQLTPKERKIIKALFVDYKAIGCIRGLK